MKSPTAVLGRRPVTESRHARTQMILTAPASKQPFFTFRFRLARFRSICKSSTGRIRVGIPPILANLLKKGTLSLR
jgi:hypothetical protein